MAKTYDGGCSKALQERHCLARPGIENSVEKARNSGMTYLGSLRESLNKFPILSVTRYMEDSFECSLSTRDEECRHVRIRIDLLLFSTSTIKLLFRSLALDRLQFAAGKFLFQLRHLSNNVFGWCPYDKFHLFQIARSDNCRSYAFAP